MPEFDVASARLAVLRTLFRAVHSYTATSSLSVLAAAPPNVLLPLFMDRQESSGVRKMMASANFNDDTISRIGQRSATESVNVTQNAVAAACLVFAHSLADGAVADFCMVAADFDRTYWLQFVETQTLTIRQVVKEEPDVLLRFVIRKKIREMSLPKKMKYLVANAGAHAKVDYHAFIYDRQRLAELDQVRHRVIHGEGVALNIETKDSQDFFYNVIVYAGLVTSSMLGLGISYPGFYVEWIKDLIEGEKIGKPQNPQARVPP